MEEDLRAFGDETPAPRPIREALKGPGDVLGPKSIGACVAHIERLRERVEELEAIVWIMQEDGMVCWCEGDGKTEPHIECPACVAAGNHHERTER